MDIASRVAQGPPGPGNAEVASLLEQVARVLRSQQASAARVGPWEHAAGRLRALERPVHELVREGDTKTLEGIDANLRPAIDEIARTGRLGLVDRLEGDLGEDALFTTIPGIGPTLARRLVRALDVHTLEELERAVHAGRLDTVPGIGPLRARRIEAALAGTLREATQERIHAQAHAAQPQERPSVELLLAIDDEYRRGVSDDRLTRIAPRRMNRARAAWLPILHTEREGWQASALFANTARAHTLGMTHDWVVLYTQREGSEVQHTVATETQGPLVGQRVVRGRERECAEHYERVQRSATSR